MWGTAPPQNLCLILGSKNAYFGAFSGQPESDFVVPATFY